MASESTSSLKTYFPRFIGLIVLVATGYWGFTAYRHGQHYESTDNAQIEGTSAPVLARVAGYVQAVYVADYAKINRGQPLLTIDPKEYEVALQQAEADYQSTLADISTAQADLAQAQANSRNVTQSLRVTQSSAAVQAIRRNKAQTDLQRDQNLFTDQSLTRKQLDDSRNNVEVQAQTYLNNQEQIGLARTQQGVATAGILKAQSAIQKMKAVLQVKAAAVESAKLRLSYAKMTSPITGKIGKKNAVVGQYVQPGQTLMTVVNDSTFWIIANMKETQLEKVAVGQAVDVKIDAYPKLDVKGRVASLSEATGARFALLPPDNASGNFVKITQRVPVKIEILNPEIYKDKLRAGLSVDVAVRVAE